MLSSKDLLNEATAPSCSSDSSYCCGSKVLISVQVPFIKLVKTSDCQEQRIGGVSFFNSTTLPVAHTVLHVITIYLSVTFKLVIYTGDLGGFCKR